MLTKLGRRRELLGPGGIAEDMKRYLIATSLLCSAFGGLSLARPPASRGAIASSPASDGAVARAANPAPIDLEQPSRLETATFALG